jgi:hypothetical protein
MRTKTITAVVMLVFGGVAWAGFRDLSCQGMRLELDEEENARVELALVTMASMEGGHCETRGELVTAFLKSAGVEPERALYRIALGKAYVEVGRAREKRLMLELALAYEIADLVGGRCATRVALSALHSPDLRDPTFALKILRSVVFDTGDLDYSDFLPVLDEAHETTITLLEFMYEYSPTLTVRALESRFGSTITEPENPIDVIEAVENDVERCKRAHIDPSSRGGPSPALRRDVQQLSEHPDWWARMAVLLLLEKHPEYGSSDLVESLAEDRHGLVPRKVASLRNRPDSI